MTHEFRHAVVARSTEDPSAFVFAPRLPGIAKDSRGRPQLNHIMMDKTSCLQLTACWGLDESLIEDLRDEIASQTGQQRTALRLQPAADHVDEVSLLVADSSGQLQVMATSKSSGLPPFHAVFSVMLDEHQTEHARQGLQGKRGHLALRTKLTRSAARSAATSSRSSSWSRAQVTQRTTKGGTNQEPTTKGFTRSAATNVSPESRPHEPEHITVEADAADWV